MSFPVFEPEPPVPIGAWFVLGLWAAALVYFGASVAHMLWHEVPFPH